MDPRLREDHGGGATFATSSFKGVAKGLKPGTGSGGIACIMTENSRISQTLVVNSSIIAVDSEGVPALKDLLT